jgi:hypothetical protein
LITKLVNFVLDAITPAHCVLIFYASTRADRFIVDNKIQLTIYSIYSSNSWDC